MVEKIEKMVFSLETKLNRLIEESNSNKQRLNEIIKSLETTNKKVDDLSDSVSDCCDKLEK